jgi:hypothetical protein
LVLNFPNLASFVGKKMEKIMKNKKRLKKNCQKIEIISFKEKMLLLMCKSLKILKIVPTLNA